MTQRNCSECPQLLIDEAVEFWIREVGKPHYVMSLNMYIPCQQYMSIDITYYKYIKRMIPDAGHQARPR